MKTVALLTTLVFCVSASVRSDDSDLRKALTFHASFDGKLKADFAKGDPDFYTVTATKPEVKTEAGLKTDPEKIAHQKGAGRFGDCLHFQSADAPRVFFQVKDNFPYAESDWQGTVSFWLRTTPDEDLEPGYTDPIQITPRSALDACFFFEFGIEDPRPCRLGVFPDKQAWNPENKPNKEIPIPERPLIEVGHVDYAFSRDRWTHIVATFEKFNNGDEAGVAKLYLDGEPRGNLTGWSQQFTWDLDAAQIRLGVKFIGGFDELSCFDRALAPAEVKALHGLEKGVTGLLGKSAASSESKRKPPFETVDLDVGEVVEVQGAKVKLVSVNEPKGEVWGEIARPEVTVEVNGEKTELVAGVYRLPQKIGGVQIDCPITGGLKANSHIDHWALEKEARLRIWPGDSPWIAPGTFGYPVKQSWFASQTSFSNEPVAPRPNRQLYYHAGIDIGGCEELVEVVAATDALVVQVGNKILPGHEPAEHDTPVAPRYDVLYLLDERGWYYRYSHLHSFDPKIQPGLKVKRGDRLGLLGKEGGSGGWTHLHFEAKAKQPSGKWGTQDTYAFLWQGYRELYDPAILAIARPSHVIFAGDTVTHDGSRSWSRDGKIESFMWRFSDGGAYAAITKKRYDKPGTFVETLKTTDAAGHTDYDFVRVKVFGRDAEGDAVPPPRVHATYFPTFEIKAGQPVTFKVRAFGTTHGEETWDFGDGSPSVKTNSDGNVKQLAKDGYAVTEHVYEKPGDYLVHVWRKDEEGRHAEDRLHVRVGE